MAIKGFFVTPEPLEPSPGDHGDDMSEAELANLLHVPVSTIKELRQSPGIGPALFFRDGEARYKTRVVAEALASAISGIQDTERSDNQLFARFCQSVQTKRPKTKAQWDELVREMQAEWLTAQNGKAEPPAAGVPPVAQRSLKSIDRDKIRADLRATKEWRRWGPGSDARKVAWEFVSRADNYGRFLPGWTTDPDSGGWVALYDEFERRGVRAEGYQPKLGDRIILPPAPSPYAVPTDQG
jgi:hypothetical protein